MVSTRLSTVSANGRTITAEVQPSVAAANDVTANILEIEFTASRFALDGSAQDRADNKTADVATRRALSTLTSASSGDVATNSASKTATNDYDQWYTTVIAPLLDAKTLTDRRSARDIQTTPASIALTNTLRSDLTRLQSNLYTWRDAETASTRTSLEILRIALITSLIIIVLLVFVLWWGLRRWVTQPLIDIAADLREVTHGELKHRIQSTGPAEIAQTAQDAEAMRQRLVNEIDEAVAAREALDQRGPVVAALRRELQSRVNASTLTIPGLETAGLLLPAEGVLAGDWFSTLVLADGRLAVVMVDVSGHGPLAGLIALKLKYAMTACLEAGGSPRAVLEAGAHVLSGESERFATAVVITMTGSGEVAWANAGHIEPLIIDRHTVTQRLTKTGPILSALGGQWSMDKTRLPSDSLLLITSDGLSESRDIDNVELSDAWSDETFAELTANKDSVRGSIESLAAAARERADRWRIDDLTIVGIRRS